MSRVAVLGAGSWGTTFAQVLVDAGNDVSLWCRRPELCRAIAEHRENADYLPGIRLPDPLVVTPDAAEALGGAELVVLAVPSQTLRDNLGRWSAALPRDAVLVSLMKGIEQGSGKRMTEVVAEVTGAEPERLAVLSGPNLAKEIAQRQPSASVVACVDEAVAEKLQLGVLTPYFRPYTNTDVVGVELGGAVKNVIALAVGMAAGMGLGDNARASIITRGIAETARLGEALGARAPTFAGLAGLGDLVATCSSPLSRNRTFGERLGQGASLDDLARGTRQVAEGVMSCVAVLDLARRHGVDMPITEAVAATVHDGVPPREILRRVMARSAKAEDE